MQESRDYFEGVVPCHQALHSNAVKSHFHYSERVKRRLLSINLTEKVQKFQTELQWNVTFAVNVWCIMSDKINRHHKINYIIGDEFLEKYNR